MARLIPAKCPQCAASVNVDPNQDVVRCAYCGTTSFIDRPKRQAPPNVPVVHLPPQPQSGRTAAAVLIVGTIVAVVAVGGVFAMSTGRSRTVSAQDDRKAASPVDAPKEKAPKEKAPKITLDDAVPLVADANGDGVGDLILRIRHDRQSAHAAYDPKAGKLLWWTPADYGRSTQTVVGAGRLFAVDDKGQVTAYLLSDGKRQWTTSLGEKLKSFCRGDDRSIQLLTAAEEVKRIDAASGGQTTGKDCDRIRSSGSRMPMGMDDPRDRRDYDAPPGVDGYLCGGVRVSGDRSYVVPDRCRREGVGYSSLDGMSASRLWRDGDDWIVLGYKTPGTRTPMVGRTKGLSPTLAWSSVVPKGNPLDANPGDPSAATLAGDALVVGWSKGITAFDKNTGKRLWTDEGKARTLRTAGPYVVAWNGMSMFSTLEVRDAKTGDVRHRFGGETLR